MSYGLLSRVGIAFQNSYGTPADLGSLHWIPFLTESVDRKLPPIHSENMSGLFDQGDRESGPAVVDGDLEIETQAVPLGALLKSVLGRYTVVDSSLTAQLYTHTFLPRTSDHQPLCAEQPVTYYKDLDISADPQVFSDLAGTLLEMTIANGELLKTKVGFVGGKRTTQSSVAFTADVGKKFPWDVSSVQLGGAANSVITQLSISVDNGLEAMHTMDNTKNPSRVKRANRRVVSVAGTLKFDDAGELDNFIIEAEQAMIIHMANATEIQSGFPEQLTITLPRLVFDEFPADANAPGQLEVSFSATAEYHAGSGTAIQVVLINSLASY